MGEYVYKVTAKRVALTDGTFANLAVFAYKESFDTKFNAQMRYESKCAAADRFVKGKKFTGKVVTCYMNDDGHTAIVSLVAKKITEGTFDSYQFEKSETVGVPSYVIVNEDPMAKIVKR